MLRAATGSRRNIDIHVVADHPDTTSTAALWKFNFTEPHDFALRQFVGGNRSHISWISSGGRVETACGRIHKPSDVTPVQHSLCSLCRVAAGGSSKKMAGGK